MPSLGAPILLSFGVGFSYQLGLEEPPESSKRRGKEGGGPERKETPTRSGDRRRRTGAKNGAQSYFGIHIVLHVSYLVVSRSEGNRRPCCVPYDGVEVACLRLLVEL